MCWNGEWDEDFYFVCIGSSVLFERSFKCGYLTQERGWTGATDFGWPQWALEIVEWS